jgi:nucleoside-diphosphate-sugar epimerase
MSDAIGRVVVTGAAGKVGRATVAELVDHGYDVLATDAAPKPTGQQGEFIRAELTDYGQVVDVLGDADAVVHLANIPAPGLRPAATTLAENSTMNGHVFLAAARLRLRRVVWASSETTLGLSFGPDNPPRYLPVDEEHYPYPESTYALSKVVSETMAEHVSRWSGIPFVGLRFSNVFTEAGRAGIDSFKDDPQSRIWNVWGWIDVRDAAAACRNALEADTTGSVNLIIASDDTIVSDPTLDLVARFFPDVELRRPLEGHQTLLSNRLAKALIGFAPRHGWRE